MSLESSVRADIFVTKYSEEYFSILSLSLSGALFRMYEISDIK